MLTIYGIRSAVHAVAPSFPIRRVSLFGSYAQGTATDRSDVDLLIEPAEQFTMFDAARFRRQMTETLDTAVDLLAHRPATTAQVAALVKDPVLLYDLCD